MEEHRLKNTTNKLKRLNVDYELNNNSILLQGASLSKGQFFLTIILPIVIFIFFVGVVAILLFDLDRIVFPKIVLILLILPLVLLYYGIKNYLRLRQSKNYQVHIMHGKIIIKYKKIDEIALPVGIIKEMPINIEENKSNCIGEIYIKNLNLESYLLLSIIDNNLKNIKDDLEYIRNTFLMILGLHYKD